MKSSAQSWSPVGIAELLSEEPCCLCRAAYVDVPTPYMTSLSTKTRLQLHVKNKAPTAWVTMTARPNAAANDADKSEILSSGHTFDSEDEPFTDHFLQERNNFTKRRNIFDENDSDKEEVPP